MANYYSYRQNGVKHFNLNGACLFAMFMVQQALACFEINEHRQKHERYYGDEKYREFATDSDVRNAKTFYALGLSVLVSDGLGLSSPHRVESITEYNVGTPMYSAIVKYREVLK